MLESRWVESIHRLNPDLIRARGRNNDYNDWLNGDTINQAGGPARGGSVPNELFATAFFAHSTDLAARMANLLGHREEARRHQDLFQQIKAAFNHRFVLRHRRDLSMVPGYVLSGSSVVPGKGAG